MNVGSSCELKECAGDILVHVHVFSTNFIQASSLAGLGLGFLSLTPLSIIFQLYLGGQFYKERKDISWLLYKIIKHCHWFNGKPPRKYML